MILTTELPFEPRAATLQRVAVRFAGGEGIGYPDGFLALDAFLPCSPDGHGDNLFFLDLQAILSSEGDPGGNIGLGYRRGVISCNRILGAYLYYDTRDTGDFTFHQLSCGFEWLSDHCDFRINAYCPLGETHRVVDVFDSVRFVSNNILFNHLHIDQAALSGLDLEAGGPLPLLDRLDLRGYLGYYHYGQDGIGTDGVRVRFEAFVGDNLALNLAVAHDRLFDTTVTAGLVFRWPAGFRAGARAPASCDVPEDSTGRRALGERLSQPVERNPNIVVRDQRSYLVNQLAIDPVTNQPVFVVHVDSNDLVGPFAGTVEDPFLNLAQAQAGSLPGQIIFAHADSIFAGQAIALQNGQRFLGEGIPHLVPTTQGTILMPRATTGTLLPAITGSPGDAVTLADGNEVSGFRISGPAGSGVDGFAVTGFNINRNTITGAGTDGIRLEDAQGTGIIAGNTITGSGNVGIEVLAFNPGSLFATISGNTITTSQFEGIFFFGDNAAFVQTTIRGNAITQNGSTWPWATASTSASPTPTSWPWSTATPSP